jgi:hypothetical protein
MGMFWDIFAFLGGLFCVCEFESIGENLSAVFDDEECNFLNTFLDNVDVTVGEFYSGIGAFFHNFDSVVVEGEFCVIKTC